MCLDYLRTLRHGTVEELADAAALAEWSRQFGPCDDVGIPAAAEVERARALREAIRELVAAARHASACPPQARAAINAAASVAIPAPRLHADGQLSWHTDDPVAATLSLVARDALELVNSPLLARVRECAGTDCGALFLDVSRPGTRRWCSMDTCGNRAKKNTMKTRKSAG